MDQLIAKNNGQVSSQKYMIYNLKGQLILDLGEVDLTKGISTVSLGKGTYVLKSLEGEFSFMFIKP